MAGSQPTSSPKHMEVNSEGGSAKPVKPTVSSEYCRDQIAKAMLALSSNQNRSNMIPILLGLEQSFILKPVYEAQVCFLLTKYALDLDDQQKRDYGERTKIACNTIIFKEGLVPGSNAWQYFHDLEIEADDYLARLEGKQKADDEMEVALTKKKMGIEEETALAARRTRERRDETLERIRDAERAFYDTYDGYNKEDFIRVSDDAPNSIADLEAADLSDHDCIEEDPEFEGQEESPNIGPGEQMFRAERQLIRDQIEDFLADDWLLPFVQKAVIQLGYQQREFGDKKDAAEESDFQKYLHIMRQKEGQRYINARREAGQDVSAEPFEKIQSSRLDSDYSVHDESCEEDSEDGGVDIGEDSEWSTPPPADNTASEYHGQSDEMAEQLYDLPQASYNPSEDGTIRKKRKFGEEHISGGEGTEEVIFTLVKRPKKQEPETQL